jgi:hypothetical protein
MILLSSVAAGLRPQIALPVAMQYGYDGIELHSIWGYMPEGGKGVYSVHAPWWTRSGRDALMRTQTASGNFQTMFWNQCVRTFERSRAIEYAHRSVRKRLIVHVGLAWEILMDGVDVVKKFDGLEVSIEEGDTPTHFLFEGPRPENTANVVRTYDYLASRGVNVSITLDPEHMAKNSWDGEGSFFDRAFMPAMELIGDRRVAEIHLVDYVEGGGGLKAGGNQPLGTGDLELERVVRFLARRPIDYPDIDYVVELAGGWLNILFAAQAAEIAKRSRLAIYKWLDD